jgi:hypothetical protein
MRLLSIILVLPLLSGCIFGYSSRVRCTYERSPAVSGTLLDKQTQAPVSGANVFFTADPQLRAKSDKDGRFEIRATQYHYITVSSSLGGRSEFREQPLDTEIMITHTNWATQQIRWEQSPQTVFLQKLPEPSIVRPWMIFDGSGVILEDEDAVRHLAPKPIPAFRGFTRGAIHFAPYGNGSNFAAFIPSNALCVINVNFAQRVFHPRLTVLRGPNKCPLPATTPGGFSWSFWPHYDGPTNLIRIDETSYVYKLEFIR